MLQQSVIFKNITDDYSSIEAWMYDSWFAPAILRMVESELRILCEQLPKNGRVLDVGCGGAHIPIAMARMRPDIHITGIDLSARQVARARARTAKMGNRMHFDVGNALDMPYEADGFDAVLSVTSIKHWPERDRGVAECVRVLRNHGQLLIAEVDRGCALDNMRNLMRRSKMPRPLRIIAMPLLRTFIIGQGLELDELRELVTTLPLEDSRVARISGMPGLVMAGRLTAPVSNA